MAANISSPHWLKKEQRCCWLQQGVRHHFYAYIKEIKVCWSCFSEQEKLAFLALGEFDLILAFTVPLKLSARESCLLMINQPAHCSWYADWTVGSSLNTNYFTKLSGCGLKVGGEPMLKQWWINSLEDIVVNVCVFRIMKQDRKSNLDTVWKNEWRRLTQLLFSPFLWHEP